jgi:hypothetical protein
LSRLTALLLTPLILQGAVAWADEWCFHRRRGLPAWEAWGHPLDTLTVSASYGFLLLAAPSDGNLWIFAAMALFSCLFVTKDEFIHRERCCAREQWLHSLLFLLHPTAFISAGTLWWLGAGGWLLPPFLLSLAFFLYQLFYLRGPWRPASRR